MAVNLKKYGGSIEQHKRCETEIIDKLNDKRVGEQTKKTLLELQTHIVNFLCKFDYEIKE